MAETKRDEWDCLPGRRADTVALWAGIWRYKTFFWCLFHRRLFSIAGYLFSLLAFALILRVGLYLCLLLLASLCRPH